LSKAGQIVPAGTKTPPVLTDADRALLEKVGASIGQAASLMHDDLVLAGQRFKNAVDTAMGLYGGEIVAIVIRGQKALEGVLEKSRVQTVIEKLSQIQPISRHPVSTRAISGRSSAATRPAETRAPRVSDRPGVAGDLNKAEQRILDALAWWRSAGVDEPTRTQVAFVARYTVNGHFNNTVGGLRGKDLVDYPSSGGLRLTATGAAAAYAPEEGPTRDELIERVLAVLRTEPQQRIFKAIVAAGQDISREELAVATRYTVNGHFNNTVGSLRSLGVIDYPSKGGVRLADLFEALS
jgi:hypothetical protein